LRALVQRVSRAAVRADGETIAEIGPGMLVLLGVKTGDGPGEAERIAAKLLRLRVFNDDEGRMNEPVGDRGILCVSQFTLYADTGRGNRPGFSKAAGGAEAEPLYNLVCEHLGAETGVFGADMAVELVNDGPVTLLVEV